jgi:hypothetical protein
MRPRRVEVFAPFREDPAYVPLGERDEIVQAFAADGANGCAYQIFIRNPSRCHPNILVMQSAKVLELDDDALVRRLNVSLLRSVLR